MDIFIEQIVPKVPTSKDTLIKVCIIIAAILVAVTVFLVSGLFGMTFIGLILAGLCFYGGFYLISNLNVEYEYIVTNGEIDIDKIIAKSKRKRLISVKVSAFEKFGLLSEAAQANEVTTVIASSSVSNEDYYAEFRHSNYGHVRLIFSPNEKVLDAIKPFISRTIR